MLDNTTVYKYEPSEHDKTLKNKFFSLPRNPETKSVTPNDNANNPVSPPIIPTTTTQQKTPILSNTKNTISNWISLNAHRQPQITDNPKTENAIKDVLLPIYNNLNEIRNEITRMNNLSSNLQNIKPNALPQSTVDAIYHFNNNIEKNRQDIAESIEFINENKENYWDEETLKAIAELTDLFQMLQNDWNNIENDINDKFEIVIREKKRKKIAEEWANGTYNKNIRDGEYNFFAGSSVIMPSKNILERVDYKEINDDLIDINIESDAILRNFNNKKYHDWSCWPMLVKPSEKVYFSYDVEGENEKSANNNNNNNNIKSGVLKKSTPEGGVGKRNIKTSGDVVGISTKANTNLNSQNSANTALNPSMQCTGEMLRNINNTNLNPFANNQSNQSVNKTETQNKISADEKMAKYRENMKRKAENVNISHPDQVRSTQKIKILIPNKAQANQMKQPRSTKTKRTYQQMKKPELAPVYQYEITDKKVRYKNGIYSFDKKEGSTQCVNPHVIPNEKGNWKDKIEKWIESCIKDFWKPESNYTHTDNKTVKITHESGSKGRDINNELLELLIKKFSDLENAIRDGNRGGRSNVNDDIANRLYSRIKAGMTVNLILENENEISNQPVQEHGTMHYEQDNKMPEVDEVSNKSWQPSQEEIVQDKQDNWNEDIRPTMEQWDKLIEFPHEIDPREYEASQSSSFLGDLKQEQNQSNVKFHHSRSKEDESNSISQGEINSDDEKKKETNTKNRDVKDLIMMKYINEHPHEQILGEHFQRNVSGIDRDEEDEDEEFSDSFNESNSSLHKNTKIKYVDINDNKALEQNGLYASQEYRAFYNHQQQQQQQQNYSSTPIRNDFQQSYANSNININNNNNTIWENSEQENNENPLNNSRTRGVRKAPTFKTNESDDYSP